MGVNVEVIGQPKDPQAILDDVMRKIDERLNKALTTGVNATKKHLILLVTSKLQKRSGALLNTLRATQVVVKRDSDTQMSGQLEVTTYGKDQRGNSVKDYLWTQLGKSPTTISAKAGTFLAIPIEGGPAWRGAAPSAAPKDWPGIIVRIGQCLFAGSNRNLLPTWALRHSVTIPARVPVGDALAEAQPEILAAFKDIISEVK